MGFNEVNIDKDIEKYINKMKSQEGYILAEELHSHPFADTAKDKMIQFGLIQLNKDKNWIYVLTEKGWSFESIQKILRDNEIAANKIKYDAANSERIYKSYFSTRLMAIIACIVSICLLLLKLAEVLGILPSK